MKQTQNLLMAAAAAVVLAASASGAVAYLKFDGVDGESSDAGHDKWSDLLSVSYPISRPMVVEPTTGRRTRGPVQFGDVVCTKELDRSSPLIAQSLVGERTFPKLEIELTATYGGKQVTYYRYELKNVQVTSYSVSAGSEAGSLPVEEISLNYEEIKVTYTEIDATGASKGKVEAEWKVEEGES
jgi:type VI secretion system secreted protein Hcp